MSGRWWLPALALAIGVAVFVYGLRSASDDPPPEVVEPETGRRPGTTDSAAEPPTSEKGLVSFLDSLPPDGRVRECLMMVAAGGWHMEVYEAMADDPETRALLEDRLRNGATLEERSHALLVLAQANGPSGDEVVRAAARGDHGPELQSLAAIAAARRPPVRVREILRELLDPSYPADVNCEAYLRLFPHASIRAIDGLVTAIDVASSDEARDLLWEAFLGRRAGLTELRPPAFEVPYDRARLWETDEFGQDPDPAVIRRLLLLVESEEGRRRPLHSFAVAAAVPGDEGERIMWNLYESANAEDRAQMIRHLGHQWAPERLSRCFAKAPELADTEVRRILAEKAGTWPDGDCVPDLRAWRAMEPDPAVAELLDLALSRLDPR
ncbi:MAG: hypothetical protein MUE73_12895 [Planctomycetes bacterium]|jgi:hypothetical protein|nr:hypothetical protein [Planctomycetota bacterium]